MDGKTKVFSPLGAKTDSNGSSEKAPVRPEDIITSGQRIVSIAPPSPEQPPGQTENMGMVMIEQPSQVQIPDEIKNVMEQMNLPNISPEMLKNMSDEQREQLENMVRMRMQRN